MFKNYATSGIQFSSYNLYKKSLNIKTTEITFYQRLILGSLAGMSAASITHPINIIRIRLQTQKGVNTINSSIKNIYSENGLKTFYKGFRPGLLYIAPFIAINFATFDRGKSNDDEYYFWYSNSRSILFDFSLLSSYPKYKFWPHLKSFIMVSWYSNLG